MDNKNPPHPDWAHLPFGGFPGEVEALPPIFVPKWATGQGPRAPPPQFQDEFDDMEVGLEDETLASEDCGVEPEPDIDTESPEVRVLLSDNPPALQGQGMTGSVNQPKCEGPNATNPSSSNN